MKTRNFNGKYRIASEPNQSRMKAHNVRSWVCVENALAERGGIADFDSLTAAVRDHDSGSKKAPHPYQFVVYCIKRGWLEHA